jgi:iron complex outermembrane receptor protein
MRYLRTAICMALLCFFGFNVYSQPNDAHSFSLIVSIEKKQPAEAATVKLLKANAVVQTTITNLKGVANFSNIKTGDYTFLVSYTGYKPQITRIYHFPGSISQDTITLQAASTGLQEVSITAKTLPVQYKQGKVILDVNASVTNTGSTVLEVLERSPGVTVDRNGGIALNGKAGVTVMIDDKLTYLSGTELANLLGSMSSTQVSQIELIANPTAKYDASGNAGIINIKTKKNTVKGFNGSVTGSFGQGVYSKSNNSLTLNYRVGKFNTFLNYSANYNTNFFSIYALRKYYDSNNQLTALLDQFSYSPGRAFNNTLKTGMDYYLNDKTTIGIVLTGTTVKRNNSNRANADWQNPQGVVDSSIYTTNSGKNRFKNGAINLNLRHKVSASQDLAVDADYLHYSIRANQDFKNELSGPNGYEEISRGNIPTSISIGSAKADYTIKVNKTDVLAFGGKASFSNTDNLADYQNLIGGNWVADNIKNNHFIYKEKINALYSSYDTKLGKVSGQFGVRYEHTGYDASQLGNAIQKDSSFTRSYGQFFPSGYLSLEADSSNSFTFTASRRIDRPPFQNLNPFYLIINKYTYSTGDPYLLPQFSWNFEVSHQYKNLLRTAVSYNRIKNYFSQIFVADPNNDAILLYTQGNVGSTYNIGASLTLTTSPVSWWNVTTQAQYNHKQLKGFNGNTYTTEIDQLNLNANNQFSIGKKYTAELSGFYTTRARNDVAELLYPTGQVSVGLSRPVLGKKGTIKVSARDVFYTNAMEGFTTFPNATEYFLLRRDSRVYSISFTYRFGKQYKTVKRTGGSASDEMDRVGNG